MDIGEICGARPAVTTIGGQKQCFYGRLTVQLGRQQARRWHLDLLRQLRDLNLDVSIEAGSPINRPEPGLGVLFWLERRLNGLPSNGLSNPVPSPSGSPSPRRDLTLDLGGEEQAQFGRVWTVTFDGAAGEAALIRCLIGGRTPLAEVRENGRVVAAGRLGTESGGIVLAAFEDVLARLSTLICAALTGAGSVAVPVLPQEGAPKTLSDNAHSPHAEPVTQRSGRNIGAVRALGLSLDTPAARPAQDEGGRRHTGSEVVTIARHAAKGAVRTAMKHVYRGLYHAPHWRTGWRQLDGPDLFDLRRHPDGGWTDLPDDGTRFYADPFPIEHQGQVTLFLEDFEHRVGRGVISAVGFGPDGPIGRPVPVLEQEVHLSYPFVFEHDGAMWMIPESGGAGTVDLFRARDFPGGWVKEMTLLSGLVASDATLLQHGGLWWMFATVRGSGGAFSDALHLWFAESPLGPWTAHRRNPVLIDIASARPAGRIVKRKGVLLRPVQDCRRGYGAALGIARITRLDPDGFEQVVETILTSGPHWPGRRLHTVNSAGGFEFIDGSGMAPRWGRGRRSR